MSHTATVPATLSAPVQGTTPDAVPLGDMLAANGYYSTAAPALQLAILADAEECLAGGLTVSEYLDTLTADYLGTLTPVQDAPEEDATPDAPDAAPVEDAAAMKRAAATLAAFGKACKTLAEQNYTLAPLAARYVAEYLAAFPGKGQRSTAVEYLAHEWRQWDEESYTTPPATALRALTRRVNMLVQCDAVCTLFAPQLPSGKSKRLAWGTLRELCPLVYRVGGDAEQHREEWAILPSVADAARELVAGIQGDKGRHLARQDVTALVSKLRLEDATQELAAASKAVADGDTTPDAKRRVQLAEAAVASVGGKIERQEAKSDTPDATPDTTPAATVAPPATPEKAPPGECRAPQHLLPDVGEASPKDVAEMAATLLLGCSEPETALGHLLARLIESGEFRKRALDVLRPAAFALLADEDDDDAEEDTAKAARTAFAALKAGRGCEDTADDDADAA